MLLRLEFNDFVEFVETHKKSRDRRLGRVHFQEDDDQFIMMVRTFDQLDYFTVITKKEILGFAHNRGLNEDKAMETFRSSFLHGCMRCDMSHSLKIPANARKAFEPIKEPQAQQTELYKKMFNKYMNDGKQ